MEPWNTPKGTSGSRIFTNKKTGAEATPKDTARPSNIAPKETRANSTLQPKNSGTPKEGSNIKGTQKEVRSSSMPKEPRKRGNSFVATPKSRPLPAPNFDGDFESVMLPRTEESGTPSNGTQKEGLRSADPNPLVADINSPWEGEESLDVFLRKIKPPQKSSDVGNGISVVSTDSSDDDLDSDDSDSQDSETTVFDADDDNLSKDSRTKFLEEEEDFISSNESQTGSRLSKSHPPLTYDVVQLRAARELEVLASLVPFRVFYAHANALRPRGQLRALREEFDGAVLFADISGFSRLAELLVRRQTPSNAAESLTKYVGWNLHEMVEVICLKGGDVMKFAGDAILAVFAADQFDGDLSKAAVCCAQAALALQKLQLSAGDAKLSVHSGMGVGRVATYEVGGLQDRWEVFVAGPPVEQIGRCEPLAKAGELVVSKEAYDCIEKLTPMIGQMLEDGNFKLIALEKNIEFKDRGGGAKEFIKTLEPDKAVEMKRVLQKYLSRPVIFSIEGHGQTLWGAELRVCSTLFCKFKGLKFNSTNESDLALVQYVVKNVVQKVMADLEGTVCRFMVDDKGAAMLLAFGLIPFCHANDPIRSVRAALQIRDGVAAISLPRATQKPRQEEIVEVDSTTSSPSRSPSRRKMKEKFGYKDDGVTRTLLPNDDECQSTQTPVSCQIGITRGMVCVGMVGGSTRCEYTLHGVLVNRAARLMGAAKDILCDQETFDEAKNEVEFEAHAPIQLKGERKQVNVYIPTRKAISRGKGKTRFSYGDDDDTLIGREKEKNETNNVFLQDESSKVVIGVQGENGIGKSRMLQYVANRAKKASVTVLTGFSLDTEGKTPFFAWKSIVIQILNLLLDKNHAPLINHAPLTTVGSKETMTSYGSQQSFTSTTGLGSPSKRLSAKQSAGRIKTFGSATYGVSNTSPKNANLAAAPPIVTRKFEDLTPEERKAHLIDCLPSDKQEYYPLLAAFVDDIIPKEQLEDNDTTLAIVRNQRLSVAIEVVVAMISTLVHFLKNKGERLAIIMDDLQWMDVSSLALLHKVTEIPRTLVFCAGTFSDGDITKRISCTSIWNLKRLEKNQLSRCLEMWIGSRISEQVVNLIYEKTDGNPLFSEELVKLMKEKHYFEFPNDVCTLKQVHGESRMNLPNSIIALMTQSLDRLTANQQIVLRVVSVMGMQFNMEDLIGVFRAINKHSFGKKLAERRHILPVPQEDLSLTEMLKLNANETLEEETESLPESTNDDSEYGEVDGMKINISQVLNSLVQKGILEERSGNRRCFVFRHAMMKETACDELLREESKQYLHRIIGTYYEEHPGPDEAQWHATVANHFFAANHREKALRFLELAGEGAVQNYSPPQIFICYSRLIKLASSSAEIPMIQKARWYRRVGDALYSMDASATATAEEHLHKGLEILSLDCREIPGISGAEAGFFPKPRKSCSSMMYQDSTEDSAILPERPTRWQEIVRRVTGGISMESDEYADEIERFLVRKEEYDEVFVTNQDDSSENAKKSMSGVLQIFRTSSSNLNGVIKNRRSRTMSMAEPPSPLRPRLLLQKQYFKSLKEAATNGDEVSREEAVDILLEAALIYDLLGRMLRDRSSSVALERRLNAIILAEAAAMAFSSKPEPPKCSCFPIMRPKKDNSSEAIESSLQYLTSSTDLTKTALPPLQQRTLDELSRAYSRAAVFFSGMHPGTRWRGLGRIYAMKANQYLKNKAQISRGDSAQHSEYLVLLQQRCGEYDAMQGDFFSASEKLRFAVWGARFMHLDQIKMDTKVLELTVFFFNGDIDSCNKKAWELIEKNARPKIIALGTLYMALCGEHEFCLHKLNVLARMHGSAESDDLASLEKGLDSLGDPSAHLALSILAWRGQKDGRLALNSCYKAAEAILLSEMSDAPLASFHTVALCFTALWDPIRDSETPLVTDEREKQKIEKLMIRLIAVVRSYAVVYKVCRPHALYCVALRKKIMVTLGLAEPSKPLLVETSEGCFGKSQFIEIDEFDECARYADDAECIWVKGLALLETDNIENFREARETFAGFEHNEYEFWRCENALEKKGVKLNEEEEEGQAPEEEVN